MSYSTEPIKLRSNRVWRTYHGGKMIEQWQNRDNPQDNQFPEEWVASVIRARNPGREHIEEGYSVIESSQGQGVTLKQLIESDPKAYLGKEHVRKFGSNPGVLVKLLDAAERLTIQVHPDRDTAQRLFQSSYGKTEAWYILGGREINGEPPYILFGFKPGVRREKWEKLFYNQDIEGMLQCLHKFYVKPGQVFLIEGGIPHAIGSGCFLLEIQEPTDYTIRTERTTPAGLKVADQSCHQGIGFEKMFECFHYEPFDEEQVLACWCKEPVILTQSEMGVEKALIRYEDTPHFSMNLIQVNTKVVLSRRAAFSVAIILSGEGVLRYGDHAMSIQQGEQIFLPAGVEELVCENRGKEPLELVKCFPPI